MKEVEDENVDTKEESIRAVSKNAGLNEHDYGQPKHNITTFEASKVTFTKECILPNNCAVELMAEPREEVEEVSVRENNIDDAVKEPTDVYPYNSKLNWIDPDTTAVDGPLNKLNLNIYYLECKYIHGYMDYRGV